MDEGPGAGEAGAAARGAAGGQGSARPWQDLHDLASGRPGDASGQGAARRSRGGQAAPIVGGPFTAAGLAGPNTYTLTLQSSFPRSTSISSNPTTLAGPCTTHPTVGLVHSHCPRRSAQTLPLLRDPAQPTQPWRHSGSCLFAGGGAASRLQNLPLQDLLPGTLAGQPLRRRLWVLQASVLPSSVPAEGDCCLGPGLAG